MILKGNDALDKANKMFESLGYSDKKDSFSNVEKIIPAYNGKTYGIVKEGSKYYIKEAVCENPTSPEDFAYIDGVQNKQKYSKNTIVEAERTLNLWNIEFSRVSKKTKVNEEKAVLKVPAPKPEEPVEDTPMDAPVDSAEEVPAIETPAGDEMPADNAEMPADEVEDEEMEGEDSFDEDPVKMIQKLAGKLAYELREFSGEDEKYGDSVQFALGMVAAAVNPDKLSEKDIKSLKKKIGKALETHEDEQELDLEIPEDEETPEEVESSEEGMEGSEEEVSSEEGMEDSEEEAPVEDISESLSGKPIGDWIKDFMNSDDPKFDGKLKKKRREMAIEAFYADKKSKKSVKESYDEDNLYTLAEDDDVYFPEDKDKDKEELLLGSKFKKDDFPPEDEFIFELDLDELQEKKSQW